jgi:hypothetical protein
MLIVEVIVGSIFVIWYIWFLTKQLRQSKRPRSRFVIAEQASQPIMQKTIVLADEPQIEESMYIPTPAQIFAQNEAKIQAARNAARAEARQLIIQNWERR